MFWNFVLELNTLFPSFSESYKHGLTSISFFGTSQISIAHTDDKQLSGLYSSQVLWHYWPVLYFDESIGISIPFFYKLRKLLWRNIKSSNCYHGIVFQENLALITIYDWLIIVVFFNRNNYNCIYLYHYQIYCKTIMHMNPLLEQ